MVLLHISVKFLQDEVKANPDHVIPYDESFN